MQLARQDIALLDVNLELKGFVALPRGSQAGPDGVVCADLPLGLARQGKDWMIFAPSLRDDTAGKGIKRSPGTILK